jgi:hypothetical protein
MITALSIAPRAILPRMTAPMASSPFSASYLEARERFRAATANHPHGALEVVDGLTIDWAWTGDPDARDVIVWTSGLHGVEGFPGSAAQLTLLAEQDDTPTLWVHVLNPWGMHHLRRVNERNVDLNRNFLAPGEAWSGSPEHYRALDPLLNPPTPPGFDAFWLRTAGSVLRHGYQALRNAVVGGQYDFPMGLFYGGAELEAGPRVLLPWIQGELAGRRRVVHVELHSGLGTYGGRALLLEGQPSPAQVARVRSAFGEGVSTWDPTNPSAYGIRGGMTRELARRLPGVRYDALTCEFGTRSNLAILTALREENRLHHHGSPSPDHPAKRGILEAFSPSAPAWRATIPAHARALRAAGRQLLATDGE